MNRKAFLIIGVVGLGLAVRGSLPARAGAPDPGESTVTMAQLPTPVAKTLTQEAAGSQVGEIDMTIGDNQATYEADVVISKMPYEIKIAMDGTLLKKHLSDIDLTLAKLPAAVAATVKQEMGNGKASGIGEDYTDAGSAYYKATVTVGKHAYKLTVLPDGTLLKIKLKEADHGDHEDGDQGHADNNRGDHSDQGDKSDHNSQGHADNNHGDQGHGNTGDGGHGDHGDNH